MRGSSKKQKERERDLRAWLEWEKGSDSKHAQRLRRKLEAEAKRRGYGKQEDLL